MTARRDGEARLSTVLVARFARLTWGTLAAYAAVVVVSFAFVSEVLHARSMARTADVIQSLLGMYADPGGARTTVAPDMLADQLLGVRSRFVITRTTSGPDGMPAVYYLSPNMPAKRIETLGGVATAAEVRRVIARAVAERGWRYRLLVRRVGDFDIFLAESRMPYVLAVVALSGAALVLLPVAATVSRRVTLRAVARAVEPLERVRRETLAIGPDDLSRRVTSPAGVAEVSDIAVTINRLVERVQRANGALSAFTADASHELRTPLTHIRAQVQWALDERRAPGEMRDSLAAVATEIDRTVRMVDDLLLLARGENRELPVARQRLDLSAIVDEVAEITQLMAAERPVTVRREVPAGVLAVGDAGFSRQILLNLASNAVRHTPVGDVSFAIVRDSGRVGVRVRDAGEGIAPEHLPRLFDRFYRVEPSRSREHGGAGLGLAIAKMLAELQNGSVQVESAPGSGSTFTLWLPVAGR